jgi:hypothetical protein
MRFRLKYESVVGAVKIDMRSGRSDVPADEKGAESSRA